LIYSVNHDGVLTPAYMSSEDSLESGFANLGDRLLVVKCNYKFLNGREWLCGAKKITIKIEQKKELPTQENDE